jgi:hypothetical protein
LTTYFTPGPWTVGSNNPDGSDPYGPIPIKAKWHRIAKLGLDDAPVQDYNSEQWANARLIAAAPDLYEACDLAFELMESLPHSVMPDQVELVRNALAKARGE